MSRGAACGKVILLGEHAVVYGAPALAVGIDRGATAIARPASSSSTLFMRRYDLRVGAGDDAPLSRAFRDLLAASGITAAVEVEAEADLPPGGGLGCSAALGVAVARALDPAASVEVVADRAAAWERVFHGNPSGVDAACASLGGCVLFQKGEAGPSIQRVRVPRSVHLAIGSTGMASSTKSMVEAVARLRERSPEVTARIFDAVAALVREARAAIEAGDLRGLGALLDRNQALLAELSVCTPEIERLCAAAREAGAVGAKLTGAGGGGSVVALAEDALRAAEIVSAWRRDGFDGFATTIGPAPPAARAAAPMEGSP